MRVLPEGVEALSGEAPENVSGQVDRNELTSCVVG
jgi:hypothetical protein